MMYAMFVGEMLIDGPTTRRITRIDIRAQTSEDLLTSLWEAMGEPSPKLSRKYVMVWGQEPGTGRSRVLNEFALALEQGPRANPMVKSYEEEGFKVEVVVEANKDLVLIAAHHKLFVSHSSEDHRSSGHVFRCRSTCIVRQNARRRLGGNGPRRCSLRL